MLNVNYMSYGAVDIQVKIIIIISKKLGVYSVFNTINLFVVLVFSKSKMLLMACVTLQLCFLFFNIPEQMFSIFKLISSIFS